MTDDETICALATPEGAAKRAIIRTSGPRAFEAAESLGVAALNHGEAVATRVRLVDVEVPADVYAFRGPRSHTGEDVVEYHVPGGPLVSRLLLEAVRAVGLREARPGEFTARAFLNGKISLDRAEAVQATIAAASDVELAAADRLRRGELGRRLEGPTEQVAALLAMAEAAIDFAAEPDVTAMPEAAALRQIEAVRAELAHLLDQSTRRLSEAHSHRRARRPT